MEINQFNDIVAGYLNNGEFELVQDELEEHCYLFNNKYTQVLYNLSIACIDFRKRSLEVKCLN